MYGPPRPGPPRPPRRESAGGTGSSHPHRSGRQPAFALRTLADIENGERKASPGTYAILENTLGWAPGSIDTVLAGVEPTETVPTLRRPSTASQGYALRPTNAPALSQVSSEDLLLELRRRIIAPRNRRHETWDDWDDGLDAHGDWAEEG
jgi:hypothetical protein